MNQWTQEKKAKENNENSFCAKTHRVEKLMYGLDVLSKQVDGNIKGRSGGTYGLAWPS